MLESIDDKILAAVKKRGKGLVFSTEEYAHYGDPDAVQKALSRMARKGVLLQYAIAVLLHYRFAILLQYFIVFLLL